MALFMNPQQLPVEELKIKYTSLENGYEQSIPALDEKWCNRGYMFTLYTSPPSKSQGGEFPMGSKEDWLERMSFFVSDMNLILQLEYHRFWSEVIYNKQFLDGINTFLQNAPPFYLVDQLPDDKDVLKTFRNVRRLVFIVLARLTRSKESEEAWMKSSTLGKILYDNFVISFPQLMEISLIYANNNFKEVSDLITRVLIIQPKYMTDIKKSSAFMSEVFSNIELQLGARHEVITQSDTLSKLVSLVLDISYSLATFVRISPQAAAVYHEHLLEPRIASFYENTLPLLTKSLDTLNGSGDFQKEYSKLKTKINISRHNLITSVHGCLSSHFATILEERDCLTDEELKIKVDMYMSTLTDCLSEHAFIRDYNTAFPIRGELNTLSEICPEIDSLKVDFILESVASMYELPRRRKNNSASSSNQVSSSSHSVQGSKRDVGSADGKKKVVGVELESLISEVKDILPHLGNGFVAQCLEYYNYVSADVINALLEENLPECLLLVDRDLPVIPPEEAENGLYERINAFDNDEFDIMTNDHVDTSRIHKGKRQEKHKNLSELLDDKSHVREMRHVYQELGIVEDIVDADEYEDEYDDTYDDLDVPVGNDGDTETGERRAFVVPRVLQQYKKVEDPQSYEEEEEPVEEKARDTFCEDPAELRARAEQKRLEARGRGRGRGGGGQTHHDVVGKPKGQGQEKEVVKSREFKNSHKSSRGNHNRRAMAAKKRRQGMFPS